MFEEYVPYIEYTSHAGGVEHGWSTGTPATVGEGGVVVGRPHYGRLFGILRPYLGQKERKIK